MAKPIILTVDDEIQVSNAIERDLRSQFGKEYKVGVRELFVKDYKITYKPDSVPLFEVEIQVPWVKEIREKNGELQITLQNLD